MFLLALCVARAPLAAAADARFTYTGRLNDAGDQPVNSQVTSKVTLYDAAFDGTEIWSEQYLVSVVDGLYSIVLGDTSGGHRAIQDSILAQRLWLELSVGGVKLLPRHQLAAEPNQCQ